MKESEITKNCNYINSNNIVKKKAIKFSITGILKILIRKQLFNYFIKTTFFLPCCRKAEHCYVDNGDFVSENFAYRGNYFGMLTDFWLCFPEFNLSKRSKTLFWTSRKILKNKDLNLLS